MILNTQTTQAEQGNHQNPIVLLHGLFGSLSNLGMIARALAPNYNIIQIDLRNHGLSPHDDEMTYQLMAQDVVDTLQAEGVKKFSLIGHSMGGKVSMTIAGLYPEMVDKLIALDVSPIAYDANRHKEIFDGLNAVNAEIKNHTEELSRKQAGEILKSQVKEQGVIMFLLKSFDKGQWLFNVDALEKQYHNLIDWKEIATWDHPMLIVRGGNSEYVLDEYFPEIKKQFPQAEIKTVEGTGHWLHAEKPNQVIADIESFLNETNEKE